MSLDYSLFRFSDDYPTAEGLSEMIMQVCMHDEGDDDVRERLVRALVNAAHQLRWLEQAAELGDDVEVCVRELERPAERFMDRYAKECKRLGEPCNDGDAWWEEWWPRDCPWHPDDIARLARLKAGETRAVRRQLRAAFLMHKEVSDAND